MIALAGIANGCERPVAGPDTATEGIVVYLDANYSGQSLPVSLSAWALGELTGACNQTRVKGDWNDCISSIRVAPGWQAVIYSDWHYQGERTTVKADIPDLSKVAGPCKGNWNDCISSIFVARQ